MQIRNILSVLEHIFRKYDAELCMALLKASEFRTSV